MLATKSSTGQRIQPGISHGADAHAHHARADVIFNKLVLLVGNFKLQGDGGVFVSFHGFLAQKSAFLGIKSAPNPIDSGGRSY